MRDLIARPEQRKALLVQARGSSHPGTTPKGLRNRVRAAPVDPSTGRRAAGFGAFTRARHAQKREREKDLRQFKDARLCAALGRLTKTGLIATGD